MGASRGDQVMNAASFESRKLARVLDQDKMTVETLTENIISTYHDRGMLYDAMKAESSANGIDNVLEQIYKYAKK